MGYLWDIFEILFWNTFWILCVTLKILWDTFGILCECLFESLNTSWILFGYVLNTFSILLWCFKDIFWNTFGILLHTFPLLFQKNSSNLLELSIYFSANFQLIFHKFSATSWYFLVLLGTSWYFMVLIGTSWFFCVLFGTFGNFWVLFGTFEYLLVLFGTYGHFRLLLNLIFIIFIWICPYFTDLYNLLKELGSDYLGLVRFCTAASH